MAERLFHLPVAGEKPSQTLPSAPEVAADAPLEERVVAVLRGIYDPELPVNIYDLGLIYQLQVHPEGGVEVRMTLTTPACPVAGSLPKLVEDRIAATPGVSSAKVELVWDPPWDRSRLSDEAALQLGLF